VTAIGLMILFHDDIRTVLWFAVVPAVISVTVLVFGVKEQALPRQKARALLRFPEIAPLGHPYWFVVAAGTVFTMARFSEAFLIIRAQQGGLSVAWAPAVIAVMSLVFAVSAYPAGRLQDKIGARPRLILGLVALIVADLLLGFGRSLVVLFVAIGLWGLHMGLTQGVLSALVAAMAPEHLRGTLQRRWPHHRACCLGRERAGRDPLGRDRPGSEVRGRRGHCRSRLGWLPLCGKPQENCGLSLESARVAFLVLRSRRRG